LGQYGNVNWSATTLVDSRLKLRIEPLTSDRWDDLVEAGSHAAAARRGRPKAKSPANANTESE